MLARGPSPDAARESPLFRFLPELRGPVPWHPLGQWPTPIQEVRFAGPGEPIYIKREDLSSPLYGGNKIRTLEGHFGAAKAAGARELWATGAFGSNHATATALHARQAGIEPGVALFRQPPSRSTHDNMRAFLSARPLVRDIANVLLVPAIVAALRRRSGAYVMAPGGATPTGAIGHVGAALELAEQIEQGRCPAPRCIVVAIGSTCSSAGLLVGLGLAELLGIAFGPGRAPLPRLIAVRATPWPVTSRYRVLALARRTAQLIQSHSRHRVDISRIASHLSVDGRYLGRGYGHAVASTRGAVAMMRGLGGPELDEVYSGKAAASLFQRYFADPSAGPYLFWATKSSGPLPSATSADIDRAPRRWQRWLQLPPQI